MDKYYTPGEARAAAILADAAHMCRQHEQITGRGISPVEERDFQRIAQSQQAGYEATGPRYERDYRTIQPCGRLGYAPHFCNRCRPDLHFYCACEDCLEDKEAAQQKAAAAEREWRLGMIEAFVHLAVRRRVCPARKPASTPSASWDWPVCTSGDVPRVCARHKPTSTRFFHPILGEEMICAVGYALSWPTDRFRSTRTLRKEGGDSGRVCFHGWTTPLKCGNYWR